MECARVGIRSFGRFLVERRSGASPRHCLVIAASVASTHGHHHQRLLINYMLSSVSDIIADRNNLLQKIKRASFALIPYAQIKRAQDVLHLMLIFGSVSKLVF